MFAAIKEKLSKLLGGPISILINVLKTHFIGS
jgi:hypothetical protein